MCLLLYLENNKLQCFPLSEIECDAYITAEGMSTHGKTCRPTDGAGPLHLPLTTQHTHWNDTPKLHGKSMRPAGLHGNHPGGNATRKIPFLC